MKKILNGPTVWRTKCPVCDCEFEYDTSETFGVYNKSGDYFRICLLYTSDAADD